MSLNKKLTSAQNEAWRTFNAMRVALFAQLVRDLAENCQLTEAEYLVLLTLSEAPDHRMRSMDLATSLGWQASRVSQQLSRMAARGLVAREACSSDRRGSIETLTTEGLKRIETAAPIHAEAIHDLFAAALTDEELASLTSISMSLLRHLEAMALESKTG